MIRFGHSTRTYIVMGPTPVDDSEPGHESQLGARSSTKPVIRKQATAQSQQPKPEMDKIRDEVTWGFAEDAHEGDELNGEVDFSSINRSEIDSEAYYNSDPRKALRVWFDARGIDMTFNTEQEGHGVTRGFVSRIDIPIETSMGALFGVGRGSRKRDAERDACLEACYKLDKCGLLRGSVAETSIRQKKRAKDIYGGDDMDDDSYYDRTEQMNRDERKMHAQENKPETYESLSQKRADVTVQIQALRDQISRSSADTTSANDNDDDELDKFMSLVNSNIRSESSAADAKKLADLEKEAARLDKLIKLVTPSSLQMTKPTLLASSSIEEPESALLSKMPEPLQPQAVVSASSEQLDLNAQPTVLAEPPKAADDPQRSPTKQQSTVRPASPLQTPGSESKRSHLEQSSTEPARPAKRRQFVVPTQKQMQRQFDIETEEVVDSVVSSDSASVDDVSKLNASYGY
eukprot:jgi/Hompol1/1314/HPOL_005555-RA